MDRTVLVGLDLDGGERLLKALDEAGLDIRAAFWLYFPEPEEWRLVFATPVVDKKGPLKVYSLIRSILQKLEPVPDISFRHITVVGTKSDDFKFLRKDIYIEDSYVYRMP